MRDEKWKKKIRKLLALSQSDNPHEAERAKIQAEKLMARHGITTEDAQIVTVGSEVSFPRTNPRESETVLMMAIERIGGCIAHMRTQKSYTESFHARRRTKVRFMGPQADAEISAYCWDVLYSQLMQAQKKLKRDYGLNTKEIERYSVSWAYSAAKKLINAFGNRAVSDATKSQHKIASEDFGKARTLIAGPADNSETDGALLALGARDGSGANLHAAAENGRKHEKRLESASPQHCQEAG